MSSNPTQKKTMKMKSMNKNKTQIQIH